jgi:hypothetical protein
MNTFDLVIPGRLRSDQDRSRSDSTGALLTNPDLQKRLSAVYKAYRRFGTCGPGATRIINGIVYHAVCGPDYLLRVNVQLLMGVRHPGQQPDADNLWKPLQNALAMPSPNLKVPGVSAGDVLYTLGVFDAQFAGFAVEVTPYHAVETDRDLTVIRVTALPPPHLELSRAVAA